MDRPRADVFGCTVGDAACSVGCDEAVERLGALRLRFGWLSLLNAAACTFAPVLLVMRAIESLVSTRVAQTGMIGPMSTIPMGVPLLGEPSTPGLVAGTLPVLSGVCLPARARCHEED